MTIKELQDLYPNATITVTRVAAYYQEDGLELMIRCAVDPDTGMVTEQAMQAALDKLAAKIALLKD